MREPFQNACSTNRAIKLRENAKGTQKQNLDKRFAHAGSRRRLGTPRKHRQSWAPPPKTRVFTTSGLEAAEGCHKHRQNRGVPSKPCRNAGKTKITTKPRETVRSCRQPALSWNAEKTEANVGIPPKNSNVFNFGRGGGRRAP